MKKLLLIVLMLSGIGLINSNAQFVLPTQINKYLILDEGKYSVENNIRITSSGVLHIPDNVEIQFRQGTTILVEGGLDIEGSSENPVIIKSANNAEGIGFEIVGVNNSNIIIKHAEFSDLIKPLKFNRNWRRNSVLISNTKFENINTGESAIEIQEADNISSERVINFLFTQNSFCNNQSNILIQELESDVVDMRFLNNLITSNYYKGFERGGSFNTPVYSTYNGRNKKYKVVFKNNSIFNNYLINDQNDTIVSEINFGIHGNAQAYNIKDNFWGEKSESDISESMDHFSNNNSLPLLNLSPFLSQPGVQTPAHIWKVKIEDNIFHYKDILPKKERFFIELFFNRKINGGKDNINLSYFYYDENSRQVLNKTISEYNFVNSYTPEVIHLMILDDIFSNIQAGYLIINGIKDISGEEISAIQIGLNSFRVFQEKRRKREENIVLQQIIDIENQVREIEISNKAPKKIEEEIINVNTQLENARNLKGVDNEQFRRFTEISFELDSIRVRNKYKIIEIKLDSLQTKAGKRSKLRWEFERLVNELDSIQNSNSIALEDLKQNVNMISIQVDQLENLMKVFKQFEPVNGNLELAFQYGNAFYYGDLSTERFWDSKYTYLSLGGALKYNINTHWAAKLNYYNFNIGMHSPSLGSFRSKHNELSLMLEYTILPLDKYSFSPVIGTGFKGFKSAQLNTSNEKEIFPGLSIPLTLGIKVPAFKNWIFGFNFEVNKPLAEDIDYHNLGSARDYYFIGFFEISRLLR